MTVMAIMPERVLNPVEPLGQGHAPQPTARRATDTTAQQIDAWAREQDHERRQSRKTLLLSLATTAALLATLAVTAWGAISK